MKAPRYKWTTSGTCWLGHRRIGCVQKRRIDYRAILERPYQEHIRVTREDDAKAWVEHAATEWFKGAGLL